MISRRGFFGMLGALAASPALAPLAKLFPAPAYYSTYLLGEGAVISWEPNKTYYRGDHIQTSGVCEPVNWKFEDGSGKTSIFKVSA